jgi:hypothetical protein
MEQQPQIQLPLQPLKPRQNTRAYKTVDLAASHSITAMCDLHDTLQSSLVFGMLSLIPSNVFRYIAVSIASISLAIYSLHRYRPSVILSKLNGAITIADEVLAGAKTKCMRDHSMLAETETRLLR